MSGSFKVHEGPQDSDLTPRPLRIAKRGSLWRSESIEVSPTRSTSVIGPASVPRRSSSITSAPTRPDPQRLHVHRQRPSDPIHSYAAVTSRPVKPSICATSATYDSVFGLHASNKVDQRAERSYISSNADKAVKFPTMRSLTTGHFRKADFVSLNNDEPLLTVRTPLIQSRRRAVTDSDACSRQVDAFQYADHALPHRQPSLKNGFITRVMSGLTNRPHPSQVNTLNASGNVQVLAQSRPASGSCSLDFTKHSRRISDSSQDTDGLSDNGDIPLAAFPTPPTSHASPSSFETLSFANADHGRFRDLCQPQDTAIVGAKLTLTPEYDLEGRNSLLVSVDIEGAIDNTRVCQNLWSQHTGLDVVVVIDNSLHTSPPTLMSSCETTRALASMLNNMTDRLAVLCTSPINEHRTLGSDYTKIWPLSPIKVHKLKKVLDAVVGSKEIMTPTSWTKTLKVATESLLRSPAAALDEETMQDTFGHIMVLTANPDRLPLDPLTHDKLQFHLICPTSVPRSEYGAIECNGWKIRSMSDKEPAVSNYKKHFDPSSLVAKLQDLIQHARDGKSAGKLTYLSLDVRAAPYCNIKTVMGKMGDPAMHNQSLKRATTLPDLGFEWSESADVMAQLDEMLMPNTQPMKILTARLRYKHSLLPAGTTCDINADCRIKRVHPRLQGDMRPESPQAIELAECTVTVRERLTHYLATVGSPQYALSAIREEFGEGGRRSCCPDYVNRIMNELKYQSRVLECFELDGSPKKHNEYMGTVMDPSVTMFNGYPSRGSSDSDTLRSEDWVNDLRNRRKTTIKMETERDVSGLGGSGF